MGQGELNLVLEFDKQMNLTWGPEKIDVNSNVEKQGENNLKIPKGISVITSTIFFFSISSGCGFLILPKAMGEAGWFALLILVLLIFVATFASSKLATCLLILEERWPEYCGSSTCHPYKEIGFRSFGPAGRNMVSFFHLMSLVGSAIVSILMISQFTHSLLPAIPKCFVTVIVSVGLIPLSWLGSPKNFWQISVISVIVTAIACTMVPADMLVRKKQFPTPVYDEVTYDSVASALGIALYMTGIGTCVSAIQNDMKDKTQCIKSVSFGFLGLLVLCVPLAVVSYLVLGSNIPENILLYGDPNSSMVIRLTTISAIVNLLFSCLMNISPLCMSVEEVMNVPNEFCLKRVVFRSVLILMLLLVALGFPDLGAIVNLIGGSTLTLCTYIFPSVFYLKLVSDSSKNQTWPQRVVTTWEKIALCLTILIGIALCLLVTSSAIKTVIGVSFEESCFTKLCFVGNSTMR